MAALAKALELDPKHTGWILLDPTRKVQASGAGQPEVGGIEEALRKGMGALPWDTLESLLRTNPDHGEARLAQAELALALSSPWQFRDPRPSADYRAALPESKTALEKLLSVPEWPWQVDLTKVSQPEGLGSLLRKHAKSPLDLQGRMAREVLAALTADPENPLLQVNLGFLLRILNNDEAEKMMGDLAGVVPLPGQAWPPLPLFHAQADVLRRLEKWAELLNQTYSWARKPSRLFLDREAWHRHVQRQSTLKAYGAMASSWREGWEILPGALLDLRQKAGSNYRELAKLTLAGANLPLGPSKELEDLYKQAALPSLPAPPMPEPLPAWRLEVRDPKDLTRLQRAFDNAPVLLQWLPSEVLSLPRPTLPQSWSASLGTEPKGGGDVLPIPESLGEILAAGRPGRLWVASDRVGMQPDAIGPRRLRIPLLLQRMPCRSLESPLAMDLSLARLGVELRTEDLDENLWFIEAQRAIPPLEEHLRRWPMDGERWEALAFWTGFIPAHQGPAQLANELPGFQPHLPFRLSLQASVHARVGDQLCRQKAWAALRAWFEPAWAGLQALGREAPARRGPALELRSTVQSFLDTAYGQLGLPGQRRLLHETGQAMKGHDSPISK